MEISLTLLIVIGIVLIWCIFGVIVGINTYGRITTSAYTKDPYAYKRPPFSEYLYYLFVGALLGFFAKFIFKFLENCSKNL